MSWEKHVQLDLLKYQTILYWPLDTHMSSFQILGKLCWSEWCYVCTGLIWVITIYKDLKFPYPGSSFILEFTDKPSQTTPNITSTITTLIHLKLKNQFGYHNIFWIIINPFVPDTTPSLPIITNFRKRSTEQYLLKMAKGKLNFFFKKKKEYTNYL